MQQRILSKKQRSGSLQQPNDQLREHVRRRSGRDTAKWKKKSGKDVACSESIHQIDVETIETLETIGVQVSFERMNHWR